MIGGGGEQKTLRLVAQYADATQRLRRARRDRTTSTRCCAEHCAAIGRDPDEIERSTLQIGPDPVDGTRRDAGSRSSTASASSADAGAQHVDLQHQTASTDPASLELDRPGRDPQLHGLRDTPGGIDCDATIGAMTDHKTAANGSAGDNPFGGLTIDRSGGIGGPLRRSRPPTVGDRQHAAAGRCRRSCIIGSGPAGLTAAIYAARANLEPIVLAGSAPGGQLMITSDVENYPGFPDGIQGPELMAAFREQAERFGSAASSTSTSTGSTSRQRPFRVWARGTEYRAEAVIVATGASAHLARASTARRACAAAASAPARPATASSSSDKRDRRRRRRRHRRSKRRRS